MIAALVLTAFGFGVCIGWALYPILEMQYHYDQKLRADRLTY